MERQILLLQAQLAQLRQEQRAATSSNAATQELVASLRAEIDELRGQDYDAESLPGYSSIFSDRIDHM